MRNPNGPSIEEIEEWKDEIHDNQIRLGALERENAALRALVTTITTDATYEGGVQFWIQKHDKCLLQVAKALSEITAATQRAETAERQNAALRDALEYCRNHNHADSNRGLSPCRGHECRVCDAISKALRGDK